jgi:hypothetical protein
MSIPRFLSIQGLLKGLAVLICSAFFWTNVLRAQPGDVAWPEWRWVGNGKLSNITAIYFIDPVHGVIAADGGILYTTIGRWNHATTPNGIGAIREIRSIQGKLYAAAQGSDVLVSTDSGRSWQFSGLGLANANDVYADGSGNIRILTDPMTRFARLDTLNCIATGNGSIFVSSDGGLNWNTSVTGLDSVSTGAFADPCEHVYLAPSSWGTDALRSTDSGRTWQSVITGAAGPYPQFIYGASTVPYVSDVSGLFRSTDDGTTWKSIITVTGGPHYMYVWGPMGQNAVLNWDAFIMMTTTGGDDDLHSGVNMTDSNGAPLLQDDTLSVPLMLTSMCNSYLISIPFWADVGGLSATVSILSGNPEEFTLLGQSSITPAVRRYDTLWLAYTPHRAIDTVVLNFDNHWHCSDWSETRTVIVISYPEAQIVPPPPIAGNCKPASEAAFVKIDSCSTLVIDSVYIPPEISSRLIFDAQLPDTIRAGFNDSLFFTFDPSDTLATISDSVEIFAHFPGMDSALAYWDFRWNLGSGLPPYPSLTNIDQFLPVKLIALPNVALFSEGSAISLYRASYCEHELDTTVTFTNKGCTPDTILQVNLAGLGYAIPSTSLPLIVPPDSSIMFPLTFLAPDTGVFQGSLSVQAVSGESRTISIPLSGVGFPHTGALAANSSTLNVSQTPICTELDTFVVIQDTGCDSVCITGVSVSPTSFIISGGGGSFCLSAGESDTIWLHTQVDTSGGNVTNNASLSILSDAKPSLAPISLSRGIIYPAPWMLSVSAPDSCASGQSIVYTILQHGSLSPEVTGVDFQLVFNDDMLMLESIVGLTIKQTGYYRDASGFAHYLLHLSPAGMDSVLAMLHLSAYQTSVSTTPISIDSVQIYANVPLPTDCITDLTMQSSSFAIRYSCNGPLLADALSGRLFISNIEPNPAMEIAQAHYFLGLSTPANATVFLEDALGRIVSDKPVLLLPGEGNSIPLYLGGLPAGVYCVRIAVLGKSTTARLIKV